MWIIHRSGRELDHFEGDDTPDLEPLIEWIKKYAYSRKDWGPGEGGLPEALTTVVTAVQEEDLLEENGTLEILFAVDLYLGERFTSTVQYSAFYFSAEAAYGDRGDPPYMEG